MKIEMDDNSSIVTVACVFIAALLLAALGGCKITEETKRTAFKEGLVEKQGYGQSTLWQKP